MQPKQSAKNKRLYARCLVLAGIALMSLFGGIQAQAALITINEIFASPSGSGLAGDANGDGLTHNSQDEFIEIVNTSDSSIDLSGWTLADGTGVRHLFPSGTVLGPQTAMVIFGGGSPTGVFGGAIVQTASTGTLSLNNSGDSITITDEPSPIASISYGSIAGSLQSITLDPDLYGTGYVRHSTATSSGGALFSPGTMMNGTLFSAPVPAPGAALLFVSGLAALGVTKKRF